MKRTAAWLMVFILLLSVSPAGAEGIIDWFSFGTAETAAPVTVTATPAPNAFRFRGGIRWGMNAKQVSALENGPMTERHMQNWSIMLTDGRVVVSRFTANLVFMFRDDRLMMISYEFPQEKPESFQYLTGALSSLYGEKADAEPLKIKALMDAINPNRYRIELITQACGWTNSDGTAVYLYYYSETDFAIMYVSPELGARIYQTNGL